MHELLKHVLTERDLTRAGDLFSIHDSQIVDDLNEVLKQITEISSRPDYIRNDHDQALIEICVTRVTSCIKETGTLEKYCGALVALLESCLHHNLMPIGHLRDDDPPHAKIASDVIACIVLISGNKNVMELFLPVAVQFLHKGNREISRHMARYLSLAAVHHAGLLKPHVQTIMDSIMTVCPEPLEGHVMALVSLLPHAEPVEKNSLFALFEQIAARRPDALKTSIPQLLSYLCPMCVSRARVSLVCEQGAALRRAARPPHASPQHVALVAAALAQVGYTSKERAQEALNFILEEMATGGAAHAALVRECTALCSAYPALFTERVLCAQRSKPHVGRRDHREARRRERFARARSRSLFRQRYIPNHLGGYTRRAKLGDSRSTGRLHPGPAPRSGTRLNVAGECRARPASYSGHTRPHAAKCGHTRPQAATRSHKRPHAATRGQMRSHAATSGHTQPQAATRSHTRPNALKQQQTELKYYG
ncbi:hypothetical protein MSG28_000196 [Choristoneura fumiferana]|uniref:Uncharacterized protein n=1 Tax=Choristoneura fumiferana TaxID=7141 RepID=A0ACC0JZR3_CHOFU|nr:hypothetical protein MSG28_000196 [Choristoneura fumiferana]